MKIALLGYGKMGKIIESIANERNHNIVTKIDSISDWDIYSEEFKKADVAIEFSTPQTVVDNIFKSFEYNIPIVIGTTGWNERFSEIAELCKAKNQTMFYASNFSIGVNIFFEINKHLSKLMNKYNQYEVRIEETHHLQKIDSPSGTAITLANDIISKIDRLNNWKNSETADKNTLPVKSIREADIVGTHKVIYDSDEDIIEIKHFAKSRKGFAYGAVLAAEFIEGKKGIFNMNDLMKL